MKSLILPPLGILYGAITRTRNSLYERGTLRTFKLKRPVISVGNITTGGTGKTPLVEWVARTLASEGRKVCILTRGYGRSNPKQRVLVSDGTSVFSNPREAGDEPYLLASNLKGVAAVISDSNRVSAGEGAIKHLGTDHFVLDDGFQHRRLARDLDIVTVDATNPWGGGHLLPVGQLREPLGGLKRADCFVLSRCDQTDDVDVVRSELQRLSGDRLIFESSMKLREVRPLEANQVPLQSQTPIASFCGVGNPKSFFNLVRQNGYEPLLEKSFADHHFYTQEDVTALCRQSLNSGAEALVTTAKDAVKLHGLTFEIPCYSFEIEIFIKNEEELRRLVLTSGKI